MQVDLRRSLFNSVCIFILKNVLNMQSGTFEL